MKLTRKMFVFGTTILAVALVVGGVRTRAVQDWYSTVTVHGRVTMYLLDDRAAVNGLLLDGGQQIRFSPRMGDAVASRVKAGDTVSAAGRAGRASSAGRLVAADTVTINGQTLTLAAEPDGPRGGPAGRGGPHGPEGRGPGAPRGPHGDAPPHARGRGADAPPPPVDGPRDAPPAPGAPGQTPPPPADGPGRGTAPAAPAEPPPAGDRGTRSTPPQPPAADPVSIHGTVEAFLVGANGEVNGLALKSGEQVRLPPRVAERLSAQSAGAHPDITVSGEAVRSGYGIIVRPAQVTVGSQTIIVR